ncbi:unnamed protein product [Symbiodinium microadriaticum]|nr:unnamed protein product [Symbiodinium microadriaticum]
MCRDGADDESRRQEDDECALMAQATKAQMTRRGILGPRLIFAVALVTQLTAATQKRAYKQVASLVPWDQPETKFPQEQGQAKDERTEKLIHKIKEHELKASNEEAKASVYKDQLADVTEKLRVMEATAQKAPSPAGVSEVRTELEAALNAQALLGRLNAELTEKLKISEGYRVGNLMEVTAAENESRSKIKALEASAAQELSECRAETQDSLEKLRSAEAACKLKETELRTEFLRSSSAAKTASVELRDYFAENAVLRSDKDRVAKVASQRAKQVEKAGRVQFFSQSAETEVAVLKRRLNEERTAAEHTARMEASAERHALELQEAQAKIQVLGEQLEESANDKARIVAEEVQDQELFMDLKFEELASSVRKDTEALRMQLDDSEELRISPFEPLPTARVLPVQHLPESLMPTSPADSDSRTII